MLKCKKLLLMALLASIVGILEAQTDSPYSRYGYGVLRDQAVGLSKGMGGIGYGLRNSYSANPMNPASYSRVDSLTSLFDVGITYTNGKLSDGVSSMNKPGGGLDYVTILFPVKKGLGLSFGILPYSSVGYKFGDTTTEGTLISTTSFSGTGGLSQLYAGLGYATPLKGLSVGLNASYLFGTIEHSGSITSLTGVADLSSDMVELSVKGLKLDIGMQYEISVSEKNKLVLGAVFSPKMSPKANYENKHYKFEPSSGALIDGDTISHNNVDAGMPATYGFGFTFNHDERISWGADVSYQQWKNTKYSTYMADGLTSENRFNDRWRYNVGVEYMNNQYTRNFFRRMKFRAGANYGNSYLNALDKTTNKVDGYNEYGVTFGVGLPFSRSYRTSYINLNFEYKKLDPKIKSMISEEYFGISLSVSLNEFWFFRRKVQ